MPRSAPTSLRARLLLHLWAPLLAVLALGALGGYVVARHVGNEVHDQWLLDSALTLAAQVKTRDGKAALELPAAALEMFEWDRVDTIFEEVTTADGRVLLSTAAFPAPALALRAGHAQFRDDEINGHPVRVVAIALERTAGGAGPVRVQVAETLRKRNEVAGRVVRSLVPLQVAIVLLAGAVVWVVVTRNLDGLASLAQRLEGYRADDLSPIDAMPSAPSEVLPLLAALNQLIARLQENRDAQRRFVANAAHQLRTPLAALEVQAERALREPEPRRQQDALVDVHRAVTRLHHVAHQLLMLMRSDRLAEQSIVLGEVDLAGVAREALEMWADAALAQGIDLGYDGPDGPVLVRGEAHLLRELIDNLLDNAIRYGRAGGTVTLLLSTDPVVLRVDDDGPGIPEAQRALVIEPFFRGSSSDSHGAGLGLAIASEIASRHGAALVLGEAPGGGLRAEIRFS